MTVYKRGIIGFIMGILGAHAAGFFLLYLLSGFVSFTVAATIALIVYLLILYFAIFSENIKFIVDDDTKTMEYYKNGKLVKKYFLENAQLSYNTKISNSSTIDLMINEDVIDCEPLGQAEFTLMYQHLSKLAQVKPIKIKIGE